MKRLEADTASIVVVDGSPTAPKVDNAGDAMKYVILRDDSATGDGIYYGKDKDGKLEKIGGGTGMGAVVTDASLQGNGTPASLLGLPYKLLVGKLRQPLTAPSLFSYTINENTLGPVVITNPVLGEIDFTLAGAFPDTTKIEIFVPLQFIDDQGQQKYLQVDDYSATPNKLKFLFSTTKGPYLIQSDISFEIRVYP